MMKRIDLYTSIVLVAVFVSIITITDVMTNRLVMKKMIKHTVTASLLIAGAMIGEWIGVITNGAAQAYMIPHYLGKFLEFCFAPAIGVSVAMAYGTVKRPKIVLAVLAAHAIFQCISLKFHWVFSIDGQNIYHRESFYFVYVAAFIWSVIFGVSAIIRCGREYQTGVDGMLILTIALTVLGVGIQFAYSDVRVDFLCVSIANLLLYSRHYKMVLQLDAVTGLLNRRCYDANIGNLDSDAVVIFFDINKFKQVNDTYGHSIGDICLKNVADQISNVYRNYGSCYRIGGDEFCVILDKKTDDVVTLNHQFFEAIQRLQISDSRMPDVALGYEYYDAKKSHIQSVIESADEMMYQNKKSRALSTGCLEKQIMVQ